jgi:hypothetical protein
MSKINKKPNFSKKTKYVIAGIITLIFVYSISTKKETTTIKPTKEELAQKAKEDSISKRNELKEEALSTFKYMVKKQLKSPDSFEKIEYGLDDKEEYFLLSMSFRANNSFGGKTVSVARGKYTIASDRIEINSIK